MTTEDIRPAMPPIVDCGTWQEQIAELRKREKAHTRADSTDSYHKGVNEDQLPMSGQQESCCGTPDKGTTQPSTQKPAPARSAAGAAHDGEQAQADRNGPSGVIRAVRRLFGRAAA